MIFVRRDYPLLPELLFKILQGGVWRMERQHILRLVCHEVSE